MAYRDNVKKQNEEVEQYQMEEQNSETNPEEGTEQVQGKSSIRSSVKSAVSYQNRNKAEKERFIWIKMWISTLVSFIMKDRGRIPDNIGDKILITNNLYITKLYMSSIIHICELGVDTPETLMGVLNSALRDRGNKAIIDFTMKNGKYHFDEDNSSLKTRIDWWEEQADNPTVPKSMRERAARCLYTVMQAKSGVQLKYTRFFITVRAKDIGTLTNAEKIIKESLNAMGSSYRMPHGSIRNNLGYIALFGGAIDDIKSVEPCMTSNQVIAQTCPNCGSFNDKDGIYIGMNVLNGQPFFIDLETITSARNMYVVAPSDVGKTVLATNMAQGAFENGAACCFMDIKGNEYTSFIKATGGYTVSLRPWSVEYINSWAMHKNDTTDEGAEAYFKSRVNFSKQQMIILSGITDRTLLIQFEELLDEFHDSLYISLGAIPGNRNSWRVTEDLTPYYVFERFEAYFNDIKRKEYDLGKTLLGTLKMYMSEGGSKSHIFKREFDYSAIVNAPTLSFDFGILANASSSDIDLDLFRLKFLYMSKLNGDFVTRKYAQGLRTFKVLEESQIVSDEIMEMYAQEYTLRRSQKQDTLLLGNSVQAFKYSKFAETLIENTRGLFVGELTYDAREIVMEQFGIYNLEPYIMLPGSRKEYKNTFFFVNNMQKRNLYPVIKVAIDETKWKPGHMYKVLTPVKEGNVMAGNS